MGHGQGVVQGRAVEAEHLPVGPGEKTQQRRQHPGDLPVPGGQFVDIREGEARPVGHVQADHDQRGPALEHDARGLRVHVDVELRRRGDVGVAHRPAHEHDALQPLRQLRSLAQGQGHVGERPGGHQGHRLARGEDRADEEIHRVPGESGEAGGGQLRPVQARNAVDLGGHDGLAQQRAVGSAGRGDILPADQAQDAPRVAPGLLPGLVAGDGGHPEHLQLRGGAGQQNRHHVVMAGIAVDEDLHNLRLLLAAWME